jgi:glycosyltransferase involved in cell wall biosynthesis
MPSSILHLITRFARGGSERRIDDIITALPEYHHLVVVGGDSDLAHATTMLPRAEVRQIRSLVRPIQPRQDAAAIRETVRLLRREQFVALYTHQSKAGVVGRIGARLAGVSPVIHSLSMASFGDGYPQWQTAAFRFAEQRLASVTASYVVVGSDLADRFWRAGIPREKLRVVRSGAPLPPTPPSVVERDRWRRELGLPGGRPVIAYVGSLDRRKNVMHLPDVLAALPKPRPVLAIAGEGPLATELRHQFERRGLVDCVHMLGYVSPGFAVLGASDVAILPSSAEGLPQVLVQSSAVRTPWVSYEVDGARELIDMGAAGTVVAPGDIDGAAAAIALWIDRVRPNVALDLSSWSSASIRQAHRRVFFDVLASEGVAVAAG